MRRLGSAAASAVRRGRRPLRVCPGRVSRVVVSSACVACVAATCSCTGFEPAAIGAAVSGAQSGVTLLSDAELWSFELAPFGDVVAATHVAAQKLSLRMLNEDADQTDRYWVYYRFGDWRKVTVEVVAATPTVTSIQIDVKSTGDRGMAGLFLRQVYAYLMETGAYYDEPTNSRGLTVPGL